MMEPPGGVGEDGVGGGADGQVNCKATTRTELQRTQCVGRTRELTIGTGSPGNKEQL